MHGVRSRARTNPNPSVVIVFAIGFDTPYRLRRITSHRNPRAIAVTTAVSPDHFVAIAAPPAAPAAKRYGLHNGAGSRRFGLAAASPPPAGEVSMAGGGVRRSIHRRSSKRKTKTSTTQNATKMSSVPVRDWTRFNPSVANRRPPVNVHNGLAHNNWMMTASSITVAVP